MRPTSRAASNPIKRAVTSTLKEITKIHTGIPEDLRAEIIRVTSEQVRVLDTKGPLCTGDSIEAKSAVVLEYVLRKGIIRKQDRSQFCLNVPLNEFRKMVGLRKEQFETLANAVRVQLEQNNVARPKQSSTASDRVRKMLGDKSKQKSSTVVKPSTGPSAKIQKEMAADKSKREKREMEATQTQAATRNETTKAKQQPKPPAESKSKIPPKRTNMLPIKPTHLHELSMKLQSKLHDPNTCEKASTHLFHQLVNYMLKGQKSLNSKRATSDDIKSNLPAYEASCFFIAAKEIEQGHIAIDDIDSSQTAPKQKGKKRSMMSTLGMDSDEEDEENSITIEDIAHVLRELPSTLVSSFKTVFPIIEQMKADQKKESNRKDQDQAEAGKKRTRASSTKAANEESNKKPASRESYISDVVNMIEDKEEKSTLEAAQPVAVTPPHNCKAQFRDREKFDKWKEDMLGRMTNASETRRDAINRLAADIMKKYEK